MIHWQFWLVLAAVVSVLLAWIFAVSRVRWKDSRREFLRKLDSMLQPKEKVAVICPQRGGYCVLTNFRLLVTHRGDYTGYSLKELRGIQGKTKEGKTTTVPEKMVTLTVKLRQNVELRNTGSEFVELAKALRDRVKAQKKETGGSVPEKKRGEKRGNG